MVVYRGECDGEWVYDCQVDGGGWGGAAVVLGERGYGGWGVLVAWGGVGWRGGVLHLLRGAGYSLVLDSGCLILGMYGNLVAEIERHEQYAYSDYHSRPGKSGAGPSVGTVGQAYAM